MENPKDLMVATSGKGPSAIPPLTVASLNLKTVINHKQNVNEIASVSVVYCKRVKVCTRLLMRFIMKVEMHDVVFLVLHFLLEVMVGEGTDVVMGDKLGGRTHASC